MTSFDVFSGAPLYDPNPRPPPPPPPPRFSQGNPHRDCVQNGDPQLLVVNRARPGQDMTREQLGVASDKPPPEGPKSVYTDERPKLETALERVNKLVAEC
jgi:hypothetical protein